MALRPLLTMPDRTLEAAKIGALPGPGTGHKEGDVRGLWQWGRRRLCRLLLCCRVIARKDGARVRLYSRAGHDLTARFSLIVEALARLQHPHPWHSRASGGTGIRSRPCCSFTARPYFQ